MLNYNNLSKSVIEARFGQADRIKISRKHFAHDIDSCVLSGRSEAIEKILNRHMANPYQSVDEIIGDLQLDLLANWNSFHKLWPRQTRPITLERIMKEQGYIE